MNKICLYESMYGRLRYSLVNGEPWFALRDISNALNISDAALYISDDDKRDLPYVDSLGKHNSLQAINLFGVCFLIHTASLRVDKTKALGFKDVILRRVISGIINQTETNSSISPEDKAILGIIHAKTDTERAKEIGNFKSAILNCKSDDSVVKTKKVKTNIHPVSKVTRDFDLKNGQIINWAYEEGFISYHGKGNKSAAISDIGNRFLRFYDEGKSKRKIGITDEGYSLIESNLENIKSTNSRLRKS